MIDALGVLIEQTGEEAQDTFGRVLPDRVEVGSDRRGRPMSVPEMITFAMHYAAVRLGIDVTDVRAFRTGDNTWHLEADFPRDYMPAVPPVGRRDAIEAGLSALFITDQITSDDFDRYLDALNARALGHERNAHSDRP